MTIDPMEEFWNPYLAFGNRPHMTGDPTGGSTDGWIRDGDGNIFWDPTVNSTLDFANSSYGNDFTYLGQSGNWDIGNGLSFQGYLDGNHDYWFSPIIVSIGAIQTFRQKLDIATTAAGTVVDGLDDNIQYMQKLDKALGRAPDVALSKILKVTKAVGTGFAVFGISNSFYEFYQNPTLGKGLKIAWDFGVLATGPVGGTLDAIFDLTGYKDKLFQGIDSAVDQYQVEQILKQGHRIGP